MPRIKRFFRRRTVLDKSSGVGLARFTIWSGLGCKCVIISKLLSLPVKTVMDQGLAQCSGFRSTAHLNAELLELPVQVGAFEACFVCKPGNVAVFQLQVVFEVKPFEGFACLA